LHQIKYEKIPVEIVAEVHVEADDFKVGIHLVRIIAALCNCFFSVGNPNTPKNAAHFVKPAAGKVFWQALVDRVASKSIATNNYLPKKIICCDFASICMLF